ncbi:RING domain-containing protein [Cryptosporidium ubiquitum]|uniref:E3 ubiquitin-protein ligase listerin n=1 Tax=Cryptosporidium ubiquitum TaxID=857276 RepID=A0A1J4MCA7_9CRYT|nr:RING domain-containing protein [Cryptosporidium ubiquitum]OII71866.1 RING domain-containing protein [Cryptosporidium ubiquitum]
MSKGKFKSSINSSKAISLLGESRAGVATSLWGIFSEFNISPDDPDTLHSKEQLNISSLNSSFVPIFTNISKKDCLTRMKGLVALKEQLYHLIENPDPDMNWEPVLSNFTYIYIRVGVYDSDVKIRRLSNECLSLLHKIVGGKKLEKFCTLFFPALWLSFNDPKPEVSKSALDCLEGLVGKDNRAKIVRLIKFCSSSMFDLYGRLLSCNLKNIKSELNANVSSLPEEEELFDRMISTSIASVRKFMETMQSESSCLISFQIALHLIFTSFPPEINQFIENSDGSFSWNTLKMGTLWTFISNNYSSIIRIDAIQLLTYSMSIILNQLKLNHPEALDRLSNYIPSASKTFVDALKCLGDTANSNVQAVSPKLISTFLKLFPEIWLQGPNKLFGSPIKYFTKTLLICLSNPNQISCHSLFSELPYITTNIPFKILLDEFLHFNNEIGLINEIINKTDFYFKTFNELMVFLYESIQENSLPLLCLIPLGIILHLVKFSTDSEDDSTTISLGTPNSTLLNCSLESYYTILLHFLHKKFTTIDESQTQLKEFLINYYSKIIWSPIIFILTTNKTVSGSINSIAHSKAQFKINEQFSNMMINSLQYHSWSIEQCRERNLNNCISNLNDFLTGYWTRFYMDQSNKHQNLKFGPLLNQKSYRIVIFLELCSILNKQDSEFVDHVLLWLKDTSHETFVNINILDNKIEENEYEIITSRLKLINKAIIEVIFKPINSKDNEKTQQIINLFLQIFTDFIQILSKRPLETNHKRIYAIYQILENIFTTFIFALFQKELKYKSILNEMVSIIVSNTNSLESITLESFLYKQLSDKETSLSQFFLEAVCKDFPNVNSDVLDDINKIFTSAHKYETQTDQIYNKNKTSNFTSEKSYNLDFKECYMNFFVALSKTSLLNISRSFSDFIMVLIISQLNSSFKKKSVSGSNLKEVSQLGDLVTNLMNNASIISENFITELLSSLIYSDNDFWFENSKSRNALIPIIDSIFSKSHEIINSKFRAEVSKLERILLFDVFNIGDKITGRKNISIYKLAVLVDRNSNKALEMTNSYSKESYENEILFKKLARIMECLNNSITNQSVCLQSDLFETGFRIRRFLRIFKEIADFSTSELNSNNFGDVKETKISYWLIIYTIKHLFISEESIKLLINSSELSLDKELILTLFNFSEFIHEAEEVSSLIINFSRYLVSKHIHQMPDFQQISNSAQFILGEYNEPESKLILNLGTDFFVHLFELMNDDNNMRNGYLSIMIDYLDSNILESNSTSLFLALIKIKQQGVELPEIYFELSSRILDLFYTEMKELSDFKEKSYTKISRLIHCTKAIIIEEGVQNDKLEFGIYSTMKLIDVLTEELINLDISKFLNTKELFRFCDLMAVFIELLQEYLTMYIQGREIQDNIEVEFQYNNLELSKLMIKLSSTIHYLVGKIFEISTSEINNDPKIAKRLDDYSMAIQYLVLNSLKFSCSIYEKLKLSSEDETILDELRFTSVTIQLETNILSTFDKFLGLISTVLMSKKNYAVGIGLRIFIEQMVVLKNSENVGKMWILAVLKSKLGKIKENAMEISKLLTTNSLKLQSLVLMILKEHNWYDTQYEYPDLNKAVTSIEKLNNCIKEYLISKNKDGDFNEIDGQEQDQDEEDQYDFTKEPIHSGINHFECFIRPESKPLISESDSENFERGIEVIASHWRRLIGPSLAQQLLETYFSTINVNYFEQMESDSSTNISGHSSYLNSIYMDVSQRLGCWNFILPKLISDDFVICTDKENPNIKTIEKNLTPCIESLLELNPVVIGEAIMEKQINLRSQTNNDFLPSNLEDEDTSICQALQYFVKGRDYSEFILDEIVLKNTTFFGLMDLLDAREGLEITQTIRMSLIHVLVELAFQTLVILEDHIKYEEISHSIEKSSEKTINPRTNWLDLFKHSSNTERRRLLTANLEEITELNPNSNSGSIIWDSSNIFFTWLLATRMILSLTTYFPRILREIWLCNSNNKTQAILQKLVINYFSPIIIPIEFNHIPLIVETMSNPDRKITFDHNISSRTIKINYSERGFTATLSFTFSKHHPLVIPKVNIPNVIGVSKKQNSNWLISVIKAVRYKNVVHAILTWINNLSLYLEGIEDCLICYSIVHPQYRTLPRKRCNTCNNIFHSECIYKWFRTSNKTTCPLCISIMH